MHRAYRLRCYQAGAEDETRLSACHGSTNIPVYNKKNAVIKKKEIRISLLNQHFYLDYVQNNTQIQ